MSSQLLELIIFAAVAFFIINRLLSTLGSKDESSTQSFFGENKGMKDMTGDLIKGYKVIKPKFNSQHKVHDLTGLIIEENKDEIQNGLSDLLHKIPSFNINKFLNNANLAFKMIICAISENNKDDLIELVDKRYLTHLHSISSRYGEYNNGALNAHISEIYSFGNNVFIKVLFAGDDITKNIKIFKEEWTFSKSTLEAGPQWNLSNINIINNNQL